MGLKQSGHEIALFRGKAPNLCQEGLRVLEILILFSNFTKKLSNLKYCTFRKKNFRTKIKFSDSLKHRGEATDPQDTSKLIDQLGLLIVVFKP